MEQYDLIDLRSFIAVVESGSFVRAAEQLAVSTAAISRRIATLEAALGSQLITRTTRRNDITEAGRAFYADAQAVFQLLDEAQERVRQGQDAASGTLRVAAPLSFGIQKVAPVLPPFMRRHPDLKVQLLLEDRTTDLHAEAIDVALRIGFLRDSSLVATRIGSVGRVFAAAPAYLARAGRPATLAGLRGHSVLNYSLLSVREEWGRLIGDPGEQLDLKVPLAANNAEALAECAMQGMGIVLLPEFVLADALADGRLVQLLADASPEPFGLFAVRPSRQFTPARLRLFIDYLRECGF
ncbi:LysR family transcriptional regulator [Pseudoduganella sp. DS3]|uniref:LysR family transcriptional regulator n=1 Tax=Pseudoduganella guangdongensis TaxID=2692179 RepID=A0A6N9HHS9_9BURK|nr:LysR family transcriptional regulator [Pseudoduganella guangdongensis]MYN03040.1 LysR family transcriptional regulator [Pseudoduganella guangdongensis]